jgi:hypothetical protein
MMGRWDFTAASSGKFRCYLARTRATRLPENAGIYPSKVSWNLP